MGNSGSTNKTVIADCAASVAAIVAAGLYSLCSSSDSGSAPNSHDSAKLDSVQSNSYPVPNSHDSCGLDNLQSTAGSVSNSHDSGGLDNLQSSTGTVPNSQDPGCLDSLQSSSDLFPISHESGLIVPFSGSDSANGSGSIGWQFTPFGWIKCNVDGSCRIASHSAGLYSLRSSSGSGSAPISHDSAKLDSVQSNSYPVPNSHDSCGLDNLQSSTGSVPNSQDPGCLDSLQPSSGSFPNSHESGLIVLFSGSDSASGSGSNGWQFPPIGWVKCNVDGSCRILAHSAGCGGVYRDGQGKWLNGFARKLDYCSSTKAEILAIYTGLAEAWRLGFRKIIIESDSKSAVNLVNNGCSPSGKFAKLISNARKYLRKEWQVNIVHIRREYNSVADWLSKFSHELQVGLHELERPPKGCYKFLLEDESRAVCLPRSIVSCS